MSSIIRNGVEFTGATPEDVTVVAFAERAISDIDGNKLPDTYFKKEGFKKGGLYGANLYNSIFRGKDITNYFTDGSLYTRISSGEFTDLYVGDYFKATINGTDITCRIAGFDIYLNQGPHGKDLVQHHAVIVPDQALMHAAMNDTNITTGGYVGSKMYTTTLVTINSQLEAVFGSHLLTVRERLSRAVDASTGVSSASRWFDSIADLMTEVEVYGTRVWSSSSNDFGTGMKQLPLFMLAPEFIIPGRFSWWLRAVVSSTGFADVSYDGGAGHHAASNSLGVRPRWLIG